MFYNNTIQLSKSYLLKSFLIILFTLIMVPTDAQTKNNRIPNSAEDYKTRAAAKAKLKDYYGAIADYSQAIRIDPDEAYTYFLRGSVKGELEDYQGAIADYSQAIRIEPNYDEAYLGRGLANIILGNRKAGCKDLETGCKLNNKDACKALSKYCR